MSTAGMPLSPHHKNKPEREMINGHLQCMACPEEDGIKGKWKNESEFHSKPHLSRGRAPRCKECTTLGRLLEKPVAGPTKKRKRPVTDPDAENKKRFQTAKKLEPLLSRSTILAMSRWDSSLNFERMQA